MPKKIVDPAIRKASAVQNAAGLQASGLTPSSVFATPKDMKALMAYCDNFTGPGEKVIAFTCAGMAWNLACKIANAKK